MEKIKKIFTNMYSKYKYYILIIALTIFVCAPLTVSGWVSSHDGVYHISRTYSTIKALLGGQLPPIIASNFAGGFGYAWNLFYPPLSAYISAICKIFLPSIISSIKLTIVISVFVAGVSMFNFIKEVTNGNKKASAITSAIYMSSLYLLVDIYTRMAFGEIVAYAFLPILLNGLFNIFYRNGKKNYLLTIGAVGILLSHNISTLLAVLMCLFFVICNFKKLFAKETRKQIWKDIIVNAVFIILITLFYYLPFLQATKSAEYNVLSEGFMSSKDRMVDHAVYLYQLVFSKFQFGSSLGLKDSINDEMCFSLGLPILIPLLLTPVIFKKIDKKYKTIYVETLFLGLFTALMATNIFPWRLMSNALIMIQFPWRMLLISTLLLSIVSGINLYKLFENVTVKEFFIILVIILIYAGQFLSNGITFNRFFDEQFVYQKEEIKDELVGSGYCGTNYEYLPKAVKVDYIKSRSDEPIILNGSATISKSNKKDTNMSFTISNNNGSKIELPYTYYVGYNVTINGKELKTYESENGFVCIDVENGNNGNVEIKYKGTKLSRISLLISSISTIIFLIYTFKVRNNKNI